MSSPQFAIANAALEIRTIQRSLESIVSQLNNTTIWNGGDADRFQAEWSSEVSSRLNSAAAHLDGCSFVPAP